MIEPTFPVSIIQEEGVNNRAAIPTDPLILWNEYSSYAEKLFNYPYMDSSDFRWQLAHQYAQAETIGFKGVHFECAMRATYLSPKHSSREEYGKYTKNERTLRQYCRAVNNLAALPFVTSLTESIINDVPEDLEVKLTRTNSINLGSDCQGITGCPEALYQLQMFTGGSYIGRIGFNTHKELDTTVVSITNLQGIPNGTEYYEYFEKKYGIKPHNYLIRSLKSKQREHENVILRGWRNPKSKNVNSAFYNKVFKKEGIDRVRYLRKEFDPDYCTSTQTDSDSQLPSEESYNLHTPSFLPSAFHTQDE